MKYKAQEKGQALIMVAVAAVVLFGFAALAIDGSRKFSDRRHAQNAADAAAMAAALASSRGSSDADSSGKAVSVSTENGYDGITSSVVTVTITASPAGVCPPDTNGKDIKVDIVSTIGTTFARVIHWNQLQNNVSATARECGSFIGPPFKGNAVVALAPDGVGYKANGNTDWLITGGGIFSNSVDGKAAWCQSNAATVLVPSIDVVGGIDQGRCTIAPPPGVASVVKNEDATQYTNAQILALFPDQPKCTDGNATLSGGQWHPQPGTEGTQVRFDSHDDMNFAPGLYCVMNSGTFTIHGSITGTGVTFYFPNADVDMKFNGGGSLTAKAPDSGDFAGILIYLAPQFDGSGNLANTQKIELLGNGSGNITGSILAPSADVAMFGNSSTDSYDSQIIGYHVYAAGGSQVAVKYKINHNYKAALPIDLTLLK